MRPKIIAIKLVLKNKHKELLNIFYFFSLLTIYTVVMVGIAIFLGHCVGL